MSNKESLREKFKSDLISHCKGLKTLSRHMKNTKSTHMFHFLDKSDFLEVNIGRLLQSQNRNSFLKPLLVVICASFLCTMRALFNRIPVSGFLCTLIPLQQWDPFSLHSSLLHSVSLPGWLFCRNVQENLSALPCFIPVGQCHLLQAQI